MSEGESAMDLSVIVPCLNEEGNLDVLIDRMQIVFEADGIDGEIILINDGSTDRTQEVIDALCGKYPNVIGRTHETNQGMVAGWRTGLGASRGRYVLTTDADLQYLPEDIPKLYREIIEHDVDLVQGWRCNVEDQSIRFYLSRGFSILLNMVFSTDINDVKSGFVIYRKEVFEDVLNFRGRYYYFQSFITVAARSRGYRLRQIPVRFDKRYSGESFIKGIPLVETMKAFIDVITATSEFK